MLRFVLVLLVIGASFCLLTDNYRYPFSDNDLSLLSPADKLTEEEVKVYADKTVIERENIIWAKIKDTHSMEPTLNENSISLELKPSSESDIVDGDIISFAQEGLVIIHRVIETGFDDNGWFARTKGDNNPDVDPWKVRFNSVKGVVVGILY